MTDQLEISTFDPVPLSSSAFIAGTLATLIKVKASLTDVIVHEGEPIFAKTAGGTLPAREVIELGEHAELYSRPVTKENIFSFVACFVDHVSKPSEQLEFWKAQIEPVLARGDSINRVLPLPDEKRLRVNLFTHSAGKLGMVIRVIPTGLADLTKLELPIQLTNRLTESNSGFVLICGPTGSGKTTVATSIIDAYNMRKSGHIVTVEDPVELLIPRKRSIITQREVGHDIPSYGAGMRDALRQNPDALLLGEIRDSETAVAAITAGESGSLMVATTHGRKHVGTLQKLVTFAAEQSGGDSAAWRGTLAGCLVAVMRLALVPTLGGDGYRLAADVILNERRVSRMIEKGDWTGLEALAAENGSHDSECISMNDRLAELVHTHQVSRDAALAESSDPIGLRRKLGLL